MTDNNIRIYYDANIFLSFFKKEQNSKSIKFLFEEGIILNKYSVYFSTYVQLEAMFLFGTTQSKGDVEIFTLKAIFGKPSFTKITLSEETINICYDLYKKHNINHSPRDIIHVASAIQSQCTHLVTLDQKFIKTMQSVEDEDIPKILNPDDLRTSLSLLP